MWGQSVLPPVFDCLLEFYLNDYDCDGGSGDDDDYHHDDNDDAVKILLNWPFFQQFYITWLNVLTFIEFLFYVKWKVSLPWQLTGCGKTNNFNMLFMSFFRLEPNT